MNLLEATVRALQEDLDNEINYDIIWVNMDVNMSSLDGRHSFKSKQELRQYLSEAFKPNIVDLLMNFDNNEHTEIIEPKNDDNCSRSCKFVFPDKRYPNRKLYINIMGYYKRPAPEPDKPLTQEEALDYLMDELEIIYSIDRVADVIIVKGEIGGEVVNYEIHKDGFIGV